MTLTFTSWLVPLESLHQAANEALFGKQAVFTCQLLPVQKAPPPSARLHAGHTQGEPLVTLLQFTNSMPASLIAHLRTSSQSAARAISGAVRKPPPKTHPFLAAVAGSATKAADETPAPRWRGRTDAPLASADDGEQRGAVIAAARRAATVRIVSRGCAVGTRRHARRQARDDAGGAGGVGVGATRVPRARAAGHARTSGVARPPWAAQTVGVVGAGPARS